MSAVMAAVRRLGLDGQVNTSYPRGLAALIEDGPLRYAVIDVGTNSVKFHIGERDPDGRWRAIVDRAEVTRLGENLELAGAIAAEPLERTVAAIAAMVDEARHHQVRTIAAVGTAGLRTARNRDQVIAAIRARTGLTVEVISGEEESRLAYLAARAGLGASEGAVLDRAELDRQIELYRSRDAESRRLIVGLQPKRAEVILTGACIVRTVMDKLGQQSLTVSDRGLRHGLLVDRFGA